MTTKDRRVPNERCPHGYFFPNPCSRCDARNSDKATTKMDRELMAAIAEDETGLGTSSSETASGSKDWQALYRGCVDDLAQLAAIVGNENGGADITIGIVRDLVARAAPPAPSDVHAFEVRDAICPWCRKTIAEGEHDNLGDGDTMVCLAPGRSDKATKCRRCGWPEESCRCPPWGSETAPPDVDALVTAISRYAGCKVTTHWERVLAALAPFERRAAACTCPQTAKPSYPCPTHDQVSQGGDSMRTTGEKPDPVGRASGMAGGSPEQEHHEGAGASEPVRSPGSSASNTCDADEDRARRYYQNRYGCTPASVIGREQMMSIARLIADVRRETIEAELDLIKRWLADRREWLREEHRRGGHVDLLTMADETRAIAALLDSGRHRRGTHLYADEDGDSR